MNNLKEVVFVGAARTPIGAFGGSLKDLAPCDLATIAVKEAISRAQLDPAQGNATAMPGTRLSPRRPYPCRT